MRRSPRPCVRRAPCGASAPRSSPRRTIRLGTGTDGRPARARTSMRPEIDPQDVEEKRPAATSGGPPGLSVVRTGPPRRWRLAIAIAVIVLLVLAGLLVPAKVRWGVEALALVASGRIPDIGVGDLLAFMRPGSGQRDISALIWSRNP